MSFQGGNGSRVRVVHLVESLGQGGLERVVETLVRHADPARFDLRVLTLAARGTVAERLARDGIAVQPAACRPVLRPSSVARLARQLTALNARVVHGHGYLAGTLARLAGWQAGVPCRVAHRHTTDEGEQLRHRLVERAVSRLGWTICCSEAVRARLVLEVGADPLRTEVVYNGVPIEEFGEGPAPPAGDCGTDRTARREETSPVILTVASLRRLKGHHVLLEAAARLAARGARFRLRFAGDGPERTALERQARALGLAGKVQFLGERHDVPALLSRANMFVLPSSGREGLGLAALEAMATGLAVVATRLGGVPEVVSHGRTGLLVPPGDPESLAAAIGELLAHPGQAEAMGRAGRERVMASFTAEGMARRVERIYCRDLAPDAPSRTILFLSHRGTASGGGQASLRMLATALDPAVYRPVVVVPEPGELAAELTADGVRTLLVPLPRLRSPRIDRVLGAVRRLRKLARMVRPDVVHVDGTRGALYALFLPRRILRVWHLRDVRPDCLDRWLGPHFDRLVAVCREATARRFPSIPEERVRVVPNGVPFVAARVSREDLRARLGVPHEELVLLTAGRLEPQKGTEELVRALRHLVHLGTSATALLAGAASAAERARLERLARELGVDGRLRILGRRNDLADLMRAADLLVHPSWYEAAPRVILEAMASGLPVIATAVGGVPEILAGCGLLVPPRAPEALAEAVARMAGDRFTRTRLAARARQRYEQLYTPERHLQAVTAVYEELLESCPAREVA